MTKDLAVSEKKIIKGQYVLYYNKHDNGSSGFRFGSYFLRRMKKQDGWI